MLNNIKASPHYKWFVLLNVALGTFMATLDSSIVNVALPTIAKEFQVDLNVLQWVPAAYILTITGFLLTFGRLADMFGKGRIYSIGFIGFVIGSILCGLSANAHFLIYSRVMQGMGAAMMMANSLGIITGIFPKEERGRALGTMGTVVAVGNLTGAPLGGILTGTVGWQSIFFINVPIGVLGLVLSYFILPRDNISITKEKFDYFGAVLWLTGIMALIIGLTRVETLGWSKNVILTTVSGLLLLLLFYKIETKSKEPLIDMNLFKNPIFLKGNITKFLSFITLIFLTLFLPFYFQDGKGLEPYQVGLLMMVMPSTMSIIAPLSGYLSDKYGYVIFTVGGMALLSLNLFLFSRVTLNTPIYLVVVSQIIFGIATGMFQSPNNSLIMSVVPKSQLGVSGGIIATMRNFGKVVGIALSVSIFSVRLRIYSNIKGEEAFINALSDIFLVAAVIAFLGLIICISDIKHIKDVNNCKHAIK